MTKEGALLKVKGYLTDLLPSEGYDEVEEIIKALKQTDTLDEIRAEIEEKYGHCDICEYFEDYDYEDNNISEYRYVANVKDILQIIDKYKADKKDCTTCIGFGDNDYAQSFCHDCIKDIQNHYKAESEKV